MNTYTHRFLYFLFAALLAFSSCKQANHAKIDDISLSTPAYETIRDRGDTLVALTVSTSASYFIYRGRTLGYEYEMLNKLADHLELHLRIKLVDNMDSLCHMLNRGEGDLIAYTLTVTNSRRQEVDFTQRLYDSPQVLVQRKPDNWNEMKRHNIDNQLIRNVLDIKQSPIYVRRNSSYYSRLLNLEDEIGDSLNIIIAEGTQSTFDLIDRVAKGEIEYTVADQELASLYAAHNNIIDYATPVSFPQKKAWAVRKDSPQLLADINAFLSYFKRYQEYYFIYDKYFKNPSTYKKITRSPYSSQTGKLSQYDDIIKSEAAQINWDWRLLASQVYQESHYDQSQISWMGAIGLMQVLPSTADMHGFKNLYHAGTNVRTGVMHLKYIDKSFSELDSINRVKFTLAAYNVGLGHVYDAQRLATYLGLDPTVWDGNVAEAILLKSQPKYYQLPECRNGYCRGSEPYKYVNEILNRYENYKLLID